MIADRVRQLEPKCLNGPSSFTVYYTKARIESTSNVCLALRRKF